MCIQHVTRRILQNYLCMKTIRLDMKQNPADLANLRGQAIQQVPGPRQGGSLHARRANLGTGSGPGCPPDLQWCPNLFLQPPTHSAPFFLMATGGLEIGLPFGLGGSFQHQENTSQNNYLHRQPATGNHPPTHVTSFHVPSIFRAAMFHLCSIHFIHIASILHHLPSICPSIVHEFAAHFPSIVHLFVHPVSMNVPSIFHTCPIHGPSIINFHPHLHPQHHLHHPINVCHGCR